MIEFMLRPALLALIALALAANGATHADDAELLKRHLQEVRSSDLEIRSDAAFKLGNYPSPESLEPGNLREDAGDLIAPLEMPAWLRVVDTSRPLPSCR